MKGAKLSEGETSNPVLNGAVAAPTSEIISYRFDGLPVHIQMLFNFLLTTYSPCDRGNCDLQKTTMEIFEELQNHCPSAFYNAETVFTFLTDHGFKFTTTPGELSFAWMLKCK